MRKIYEVPLGADFIKHVASFLGGPGDSASMERCALVFPGKRPSLYLKKELARSIRRPFYPPRTYSIEEFVDYTFRKTEPLLRDVDDIDALMLLHKIVAKEEGFSRGPLGKKDFGDFFPWGFHLLGFIDQVDREMVHNSRLASVESNAEIGYDVPAHVNDFLGAITGIREAFHAALTEEGFVTAGLKCLLAAQRIGDVSFDEFDRIVFAGPFGLTGTEKAIIGGLWSRDKAEIIIEGAANEWDILGDLVSSLDAPVERIAVEERPGPEITIHGGFDRHREILAARELTAGGLPGKTAIILPSPEALIPLLSFGLPDSEADYNISLGYPLQRTGLFGLISGILRAQTARRGRFLYPVSDYLAVVLHPFVKNLEPAPRTRTVLLALKRMLTGEIGAGGPGQKPFVSLGELEQATEEANTGDATAQTAAGGCKASRQVLEEIHQVFFRNFEKIRNIHEMAAAVEAALGWILHHTPARSYVLSGEVFKAFFTRLGDLRRAVSGREPFHRDSDENRRMVCDFLDKYLQRILLPFNTTPVEPLEILGVLETRNIAFDTVIVLDVNEGILPKPKKVDPLIPMGIYEKLGIASPKHNEEMYRYHFFRLIKSSRRAHLLYLDSDERPRSRYIEEILWEKEKESGMLDVLKVERSPHRINLNPQPHDAAAGKCREVMDYLEKKTYSPSVIDTYLRCPLIFYFRHVLGFEETREISEDIDHLDRGTAIHAILAATFAPFLDREITSASYEPLRRSLAAAVERHFSGKIMSGDHYLFKKLATHKLEYFLARSVKETKRAYIVRYVEHPLTGTIAAGGRNLSFRGTMDRIDYYPDRGEHVIIDYKTGGANQYPRRLPDVSGKNGTSALREKITTLQLPVYVALFTQSEGVPLEHVQAKLVLLKNNREEMLFPGDDGEEKAVRFLAYREVLRSVLEEILDPERPFRRERDEACPACPYAGLCDKDGPYPV